MNKSLIALIIASFITVSSCVKKPEPTPNPNPTPTPTANEVHFNFENYFGSQELELNTATYTTMNSEQINISMFNYWITNIVFINKDGTEYKEPESYRLLRGDKTATHHFHVGDVPAGTYTGIKFIIGVDVPRNTSGAQDGALDPTVNGDMYWSWSTGYIQAKLEGTSPQSKAANNAVIYHIGGVEPGKETPRNVTLNFGTDMVIGAQAGSIKIKADAAKWFGPGNPILIEQVSSTTHGGSANSIKLADNYQHMFSITSVGNE